MLAASLSAVTLMLATSESFARSGTAAGFSSARGIPHASPVPWFRHHRRHGIGTYWPGAGSYDDGGANGVSFPDALPDVTQPMSREVRYIHDVPWDWAHRYPPNVMPSDRPYVSSCSTEPVTVPGRNGERTINITRCY